MRSLVFVFAISYVLPCCVGAQINVSVCARALLDPSTLNKAKAETAFVFGAAGLPITWMPCGDFQAIVAKVTSPVFIIRVRTSPTPRPASRSLTALGKAFLAEDDEGLLADAYLNLIQETAAKHEMEQGLLLGCVMAHELGHLLLGPGHEPFGLMRPNWNAQQLKDIGQRRLRFSHSDATRLQRASQVLEAEYRQAREHVLAAGIRSHCSELSDTCTTF